MDCGARLACEADLELKAKATADKPLPNLAMRRTEYLRIGVQWEKNANRVSSE